MHFTIEKYYQLEYYIGVPNYEKEEFKMAHVISDECISCGACAAECPVSAIAEGDGKFVVGEDCIDCGACESVCPTGAVTAE